MTYRWVHVNCPYIPFVLLVDDDYLVSWFKATNYIEDKANIFGCPMYGTLVRNWHPVQQKVDPNNYITSDEYPFSCFPDYISDYISGGSILICFNTIKCISTLFHMYDISASMMFI